MLDSHTDTAQTLYEGDQSKLYSGLLAHHEGGIEDSASKKQIRRILKVMLILSAVTIAEVGLGLYGHYQGMNVGIRNTFFVIMTIFKAAYIVKVFMHLGDEFKNFFIAVMIPLVLFIWFIIAFLADGHSWLRDNQKDPARNEQLFVPQGG